MTVVGRTFVRAGVDLQRIVRPDLFDDPNDIRTSINVPRFQAGVGIRFGRRTADSRSP